MNFYRLPAWQQSLGTLGGVIATDLTATFSVIPGSVQEQALQSAGAIQVDKPGGGSVASYGPLFPAASLTYGAIMDAYNGAKAAGGGLVGLPPGQLSLAGHGSLPESSGIGYLGAGWTLNYGGVPDDASATPGSGTWLIGDGTFPAFAGNSTDGVSAYPTQAAFAQAGLTGISLRGIGVSNFSHGCKIGSNYNPGSFYSVFDNIVAIGCGVGFHWENSLHNDFGRVYAINCSSVGIRWRSSSTTAILQPANCKVGEALVSVPTGSFTARGIVISCANGTIGGIAQAEILQSNRFGGTTSSQTATTNGTTTIAVSDTSKYALSMPVAFSSLGGATGLVLNQIYFVTAIVANTSIKIANAPFGSNLSPGAGTPTILTQGMPCFEMTIDDATSGNNPQCAFIGTLDIEAGGTCKALLQNLPEGIVLNVSAAPPGSTQDICVRNSNVPIQIQPIAAKINIDTSDGNSNQVQMLGYAPEANSIGPTFGIRGNAARKSLNLSLVNGGLDTFEANTVGGWDLLQTSVPICEYAGAQVSTSFALTTQYAGLVEYNGGAGNTISLPTITGSAMSGLPFKLVNRGSASVAFTTASGQGFNDTTRTSVTVNPGASISVAAQTLSGTDYWQVTGIGGTYSAGTISTM